MHYILTLFVMGVVVLAHEFGHFLAATAVGMPIKVFSIGFGPKLWSVQKGETEYRISAVPIGGYVMPALESEEDLFRIPWQKRALMSAGGPLASLLFPLVCFALMNWLIAGFSGANVFVRPVQQLSSIFVQILMVIPMLFTDVSQLSGVVGIVSMGGEFLQLGVEQILYFAGFLSVNLAVFNLLPIPALDGGKILLYLLERISPRFQKWHVPLALAGWALMVVLILYTTIMDIGRLTIS